MRLVVLRCGTDIAVPPSTQLIDVKAVPTRQELKALDSLAAEVLPEDPTPSLAEIAAQPDVAHLGTPQYAPQPISDPLRAGVVGSAGALRISMASNLCASSTKSTRRRSTLRGRAVKQRRSREGEDPHRFFTNK